MIDSVWYLSDVVSFGQLTVEADRPDVLQELLATSVLHLLTNSRLVRTKVLLHVVQGVGHGIHRVDHKLHLPFLLIFGVCSYSLLSWKKERKQKLKQSEDFQTSVAKCVPKCSRKRKEGGKWSQLWKLLKKNVR